MSLFRANGESINDNRSKSQIAISFQKIVVKIRGEDCDPFRVIHGKYFSFDEYSFIYIYIF